MEPPLISVIIPTYNRASFLPQAVESALGQAGVEVEVIIVDDGSTDETPELVNQRASVWGDRVSYVRQQNSERSAARNNGLCRARGEYVTFLDSDDLWRPDHARKCIEALRRHPEAVAAYGEYGLMSADNRPICETVKRPASEGKHFMRDLCLKRLILHPTEVVLRRSMLTSNELFDRDIPGAEDWLLWVRLATEATFKRVGVPTVWMRVHPKGTFGDPDKFSRSLMTAAEKVISTGAPRASGISNDRIRAINQIHSAYAYYLAGRFSLSRKLLMKAAGAYKPSLVEADFWKVLARLCLGKSISRRIRAARHRGSGGVIDIASTSADS